MRKSLESLERRIDWVDTDNLYEAVNRLKECMIEMLEFIDQALPKEVEPD